MLRNTFLVAVLSLASMGIASANSSNEITLTRKTMVGSTVLKPGTYKVKVDGSNAVFQRKYSSKSYTAPVNVSDNDHAFGKAVVHTSKNGKLRRIDEVDLGGSTTRLQFQ